MTMVSKDFASISIKKTLFGEGDEESLL